MNWNRKEVTAMEQFKIGDVVKLKSGGPPMTIREVKATEIVCAWFGPNEQIEIWGFGKEMLVKVEGQ